MSYSVSKTALDALTIEHAKAEPDLSFHVASPGHCKTAFNSFRGTKDPLDGAKVVVVWLWRIRDTRIDFGRWRVTRSKRVQFHGSELGCLSAGRFLNISSPLGLWL